MLVAILFLLLIITGIIIFVPPFHWLIIFSLIALISLITFLALRLFVKLKYTILISLLIFFTLSLLSLGLFDPVNVVLTISLFVGTLILIK
ncbi:hypothetical protein COY13_01605 [Candidatus Roizmanbacteria bacterium CG_4_10_14_0_2_um_filter_36_35]|uniref:Uncharacterized protein n=2 Tax=Candidatus Roizmaniibacteriota TaxID=1752723 RepID=A0A2M7UAJ7_9BACT|nr:MAG: hypothetical protein COY13_01605 [Candidatus Roizmanbacteria bacterium CG_4_10_14_0_2_um_filter_36_35]PJC30732.1 MAG: hypothetical protein CO049_04885 [Candidatus Roizmanbacteria bacterium CG_4_9_14_0_2_um_filter_36_12]PJC80291.1 MAG: hypothetical protein CO008_02310 [Candidatus Roizmanbacteria bacterium CG_4_8_14_3_um_filter_36_12]